VRIAAICRVQRGGFIMNGYWAQARTLPRARAQPSSACATAEAFGLRDRIADLEIDLLALEAG